MSNREAPAVMARKRADCKRQILAWAEHGRSADKHALGGEFTSDDAAALLGKKREQIAGYLKQMVDDERTLNRTFKYLRWYYTVNDEPRQESAGFIRLVERNNDIRIGGYYPPKPVTGFAELVRRHAE